MDITEYAAWFEENDEHVVDLIDNALQRTETPVSWDVSSWHNELAGSVLKLSAEICNEDGDNATFPYAEFALRMYEEMVSEPDVIQMQPAMPNVYISIVPDRQYDEFPILNVYVGLSKDGYEYRLPKAQTLDATVATN